MFSHLFHFNSFIVLWDLLFEAFYFRIIHGTLSSFTNLWRFIANMTFVYLWLKSIFFLFEHLFEFFLFFHFSQFYFSFFQQLLCSVLNRNIRFSLFLFLSQYFSSLVGKFRWWHLLLFLTGIFQLVLLLRIFWSKNCWSCFQIWNRWTTLSVSMSLTMVINHFGGIFQRCNRFSSSLDEVPLFMNIIRLCLFLHVYLEVHSFRLLIIIASVLPER